MAWILLGVVTLLCLAALALSFFLWRKNRKCQTELAWLREVHDQYTRNPSILAHEIRSPLTVLIGNSELLRDEAVGKLNDRQIEMVARIETNANLLRDMAEDFLMSTRLDAQLFELKIQTFDIVSLIRQVVNDLASIRQANLTVNRRGRPIWVQADRRLIRQALTNLINNAINHAGLEARITIRPYRNDEGCVIEINDTGAGMSETEREQLFKPFTTGNTGRPGAGLGMMITEKIIHLHQGKILVDSIAQHGTTIFVILPYTNQKGKPSDDHRIMEGLGA